MACKVVLCILSRASPCPTQAPGHYFSPPRAICSRAKRQLPVASLQGCLTPGARAVPGVPRPAPGVPRPALLPGWACGTGPGCEARPWGTPSHSQPLGTPGPAAPRVIWISGLKGRQGLLPKLHFTLSKFRDALGMHKGPASVCT